MWRDGPNDDDFGTELREIEEDEMVPDFIPQDSNEVWRYLELFGGVWICS